MTEAAETTAASPLWGLKASLAVLERVRAALRAAEAGREGRRGALGLSARFVDSLDGKVCAALARGGEAAVLVAIGHDGPRVLLTDQSGRRAAFLAYARAAGHRVLSFSQRRLAELDR